MTINLSGSLSEFSLAEVLALLGMGGRTAHMQVTSADAVGTVHLVEGRISSATADSTRAGLLRGIVAALPVPADDLAHALQSEDPVRALVESGVVERDAAQKVAAENAIEAVGQMLDWGSGEFAVWVGSQDPADIGVRLDVDDLVGAARERAAQWRDLRAALPESDSVLALVPDVAQAPVLDRDDWGVLARVDGRRTLAEILAAMGASPLAAGNRLVELMGRGLVAVHVRAGDVELDRTNQMLDAFEAGPVDEVVELAASHEPDFGTDVHDLFVTEPEAVEEWQVAGAEPWVVAEPEPALNQAFETAGEPTPFDLEPVAFDVEPMPYEFESVEFAAEPVGFDVEAVELAEPVAFDVAPSSLEEQAAGFEVEPVAYDLDAVGYEPDPSFYEPDPSFYEPDPVSYSADAFSVEPDVPVVAPMTFEVEPGAEPVAESFAWSPWAQEMGLGEAPTVAAAAPEASLGQSFADMVEGGGGHGHTDAFPVPLAPAPADAPAESVVLDEVAPFVPQPRDPGDAVADPAAHALSVGSHAASPQDAPTPEVQSGSEVPETQPESAPDPLAGGLLAHLMSSVRGL